MRIVAFTLLFPLCFSVACGVDSTPPAKALPPPELEPVAETGASTPPTPADAGTDAALRADAK